MICCELFHVVLVCQCDSCYYYFACIVLVIRVMHLHAGIMCFELRVFMMSEKYTCLSKRDDCCMRLSICTRASKNSFLFHLLRPGHS